jgi:ABC-2 type transport system permease protein
MINYYLAVSLMILSYRRFWAIHYNVFSDINEGNLSIYLARPIDYQFQWLARMVATLSINVLFTLPVLVISSFLMQLPLPNLMSLLLFFISIYLSAAVLFFIQFCIGTLSFWTERIFATRDLLLNIQSLFSGAIVPLAVFPSIVQEISNYLPFRSIYFVPASIYAGYFSNIEALYNLGIQVFWVFCLFVLSRSFFNKGLVKFDAKGG